MDKSAVDGLAVQEAAGSVGDRSVSSDKLRKSVEVALILLRNQSTVAERIDPTPYVEQAFELALSGRSSRSPAYVLIGLYAQDAQYQQHKRTAALIDRVSALIESAEPDDYSTLPALLLALANDGRNDLKAHWVKSINKIAQTCIRLLNKHRSMETPLARSADAKHYIFLLSVIRSFLVSDIKTLWSPFLPSVRELAAWPLFLSTAIPLESPKGEQQPPPPLAAQVFGLSQAIAPADQWTGSWSQLITELCAILHALSLPLPSAVPLSKSKAAPQGATSTTPADGSWSLQLDLSRSKKSLKGISRALQLRDWLHGVCCLLSQMIVCGSVHTTVSIPLKSFLSMFKELLAHRMSPSMDSQLSYVENEKGLSAVDVALVLDAAKQSMLSVMEQLLRSYSSAASSIALARRARLILNPLTKTLHSMSAQVLCDSAIGPALLTCLQAACVAFPQAFAETVTAYENLQSSSALGNDLVQAFQYEIQRLTLNPALLSDVQVASRILGKRAASDASTVQGRATLPLFALLETFLTHCALYMSPTSRTQIQLAVKTGLVSIERGVTLYATPHHVKEGLRQNATVLQAFLSVAQAEVLAGSPTSVFSSNIFRLQRVCISLQQVDVGGIGLTASSLLLSLGHILQPSQLVLPSFPTQDLVQQQLAHALAASAPATKTASAEANPPSESATRPASAPATASLSGPASSSAPISVGETRPSGTNTYSSPTVATQPTASARIDLPTNLSAPKRVALPTTTTETRGKGNDDEDEEDDLPELDVGSEVDE